MINSYGEKMNFLGNETELVMIGKLDEDDLHEVKLQDARCNVVYQRGDVINEWHVKLSHWYRTDQAAL